MTFQTEYYPTIEEVREQIRNCEGRHTQQIAYSSFHDCLTQICWGCKVIRSNINLIEKEKKNELPRTNRKNC